MMSSPAKKAQWLTAEQIDQIIVNASADDVIEAMALYPNAAEAPMQISREIFNRSAARLEMTNGRTASQMIPAHDFGKWAEKLGELMRVDNPLSEASDLSPTSADIGE